MFVMKLYTGRPLEVTTIGFVGGVPLPGGTGSDETKQPKIVYSINDITLQKVILVHLL